MQRNFRAHGEFIDYGTIAIHRAQTFTAPTVRKVRFKKMASCCCDECCELVEKFPNRKPACVFPAIVSSGFSCAGSEKPARFAVWRRWAKLLHKASASFPRLPHTFSTQGAGQFSFSHFEKSAVPRCAGRDHAKSDAQNACDCTRLANWFGSALWCDAAGLDRGVRRWC